MSDVPITVEYFAQARAASGQAREVVSIAAGTALSDVSRRFAETHDPKLAALLLAPSTIIAVDGAQISPSDDIKLRGGETIMIIPPISGGQP
jgi:sulfur-carrier protein